MPGKNPHRPEGKTADAERMRLRRSDDPGGSKRTLKDDARDQPRPTHVEAEEQVGGSRPGVPSLVKEAIEDREAREGPDAER